MRVDTGFLECRFLRRLEWKEEDGRIVVLRPRFGEGRIGRWLESSLGLSPYRIRLDEIGTVVWKLCDGNTPACEVAAKLRQEFGNRVEPAEDRLHYFVRRLIHARMIQIQSGDGSL